MADDEAGQTPTGRISGRQIYDGRIVHLSVDRVRFPDGTEGELEMIRHPGASAVLPFLDPPTGDDPRVILIRQYRYAASGHIWEVPAGMPDSDDEPWDTCADRELVEETGLRAAELRYLTRIYTTPGFTDEVIHLFAATGLEEVGANRDADEFLEVETVRFSEAVDGVRTGRIVDAKSVASILYAAQFLPGRWEEDVPVPAR
jgi:ADP-ribose pyrophosphatase